MTVALIIVTLLMLISAIISWNEKSKFCEQTVIFLSLTVAALLANGTFHYHDTVGEVRSKAQAQRATDFRINESLRTTIKELKAKYEPVVPEVVKVPEPVLPEFKGTITTVPALVTLSSTSISLLRDAAQSCNIAKIEVVTNIDNMTDAQALNIIKQCEIYKLKKELQSD